MKKMKAVILNSGLGKRMGELSKDKPKCLIELSKGETILGRQLKILINNGVTDIIMTTGHFEDKIKNYIKKKFPELHVKYVHNPKYDSTNCIYSLFLTKEFIDDDVIFMTGDLVFDKNVFQRLLNSDEQNIVLVNKEVKPPKTEFKSRIEDNMVKEINVNIFGEKCFFSIPIYKVSKEAFLLWLLEVEKFVKKGKTNVFAEEAFNNISSRIKLKPLYFNNELCMEVDNNCDLEIARKRLSKKEVKGGQYDNSL